MIRIIEIGQKNDKNPLVAIPGIDGSIGSIEPIVNKLAQNRQVIVIDYSEENNKTLEALATEIADKIKSWNIGRIDILGQSIGTILAAQVASLHGIQVGKVVFACTFTKLNWNKLKLSNFILRLTPDRLYKLSSPSIMAMVCGPVGDGKKHPFFEASKNSNKAGVIKRTRWEINKDFAEDLVKVDTPSLFLMGEKDRFVTSAKDEIDRLKRLFTDHPAKIVSIANAGHVLLPSAAISTAVTQIEKFLTE